MPEETSYPPLKMGIDTAQPLMCWRCQERIETEEPKIVVAHDEWLYVYHRECAAPFSPRGWESV